jgi:hypothetical protein
VTRWAVLLLGLGAAACPKPSRTPDAGAVVLLPGEHTDLKAAMIRVYPDFRASRVTHVHAGLVRSLRIPELNTAPFRSQVQVFTWGRGFGRSDAGVEVLGARAPYSVHYSEPTPIEARLELRMELKPDDLMNIAHSPVPPTSRDFAAKLPRPHFAQPGQNTVFYFSIGYDESSGPGDLLLRRVMVGWVNQGYVSEPAVALDPDGGIPALGENWSGVFEQRAKGARIEARKQASHFELKYEQRIPEEEPPR